MQLKHQQALLCIYVKIRYINFAFGLNVTESIKTKHIPSKYYCAIRALIAPPHLFEHNQSVMGLI